MKIEHTRLAGFDRSPEGTTWLTIEHGGNQYVVKRETNSSGMKGPYQYRPYCGGVEKEPIEVTISGGSARVKAFRHDFVDITLAVQLAKFIEEQLIKSIKEQK